MDWTAVHALIAQRGGFPCECPICYERFLSRGVESSSAGGFTSPRAASTAGLAERVSDLLGRSAPAAQDATGGELTSASAMAAARETEAELLREGSVAPGRGRGVVAEPPSGGLVGPSHGDAGGAAPQRLRASSMPGRVEGAEELKGGAYEPACDSDSAVVGRRQTSPGGDAGSAAPSPCGAAADATGSGSGLAMHSVFESCDPDAHARGAVTSRLAGAVTPRLARASPTAIMASSGVPPDGDVRGGACSTLVRKSVSGMELPSVPGLLVTSCGHAFHASCLLMYEKFHTLNAFTRAPCPVCRTVYRKHVAKPLA